MLNKHKSSDGSKANLPAYRQFVCLSMEIILLISTVSKTYMSRQKVSIYRMLLTYMSRQKHQKISIYVVHILHSFFKSWIISNSKSRSNFAS